MKTGSLSGLIDETMSVVYDSGVISTATTSIVITGLDGDTDGDYQLISFVKSTPNYESRLYLNGDTGSNYMYRHIYAVDTTYNSNLYTGQSGIRICGYSGTTNNPLSFSIVNINAVSGTYRLGSTRVYARAGSGTDSGYGGLLQTVFMWNNTVDNITSMTIQSETANGIQPGSRFVLLRRENNTKMQTGVLEPQGILPRQWEKIAQLNVEAYLEIPDSDDWNMFANTTEDWTIDFWFKTPEPSVSQQIMGQYQDTDNRWAITTQTNGITFGVKSGGTWIIDMPPTGTAVPADTWTHIVIAKIGTDYGIYVNGQQESYQSNSSTSAGFASKLYIGHNGAGLIYFDGAVDEVRIYKGNPFNASPNSGETDTITVPTAEHTPDNNTKLLLHGEDITDSSTASRLDIINNNVTLSTSGKFGSAGVFSDSSSTYLRVKDDDRLDFIKTTGVSTIDFWVKHSSAPGTQYYFQHEETTTNMWRLYHNGATEGIKFYANNGAIDLQTGVAITDTNWHHIAVCRVGSEYGVYLDGNQIGYVSYTGTATPAVDAYIGAYNGGSLYVDGLMDEFRITHSNPFNASPNSSNTDTITVPTASHTVDDDTVILLHFDDKVEGDEGKLVTTHFVTVDEVAGYFNKGFKFSAEVSEFTITGIDGDVDSLYYIVMDCTAAGSTAVAPRIVFNSDTGSTSYHFQRLSWGGGSSTISAAHNNYPGMVCFNSGTYNGNHYIGEFLCYTHSGTERLGLSLNGVNMSDSALEEVNLHGNIWYNTTNNVTSLTINANGAISQGSSISIYRLRGE